MCMFFFHFQKKEEEEYEIQIKKKSGYCLKITTSITRSNVLKGSTPCMYQLFSLGSLVSSSNKTDCHDTTVILLKVE